MPKTLDDDERLQALLKLKDDLETFAAFCLRVKDKGGRSVDFNFNKAQRYIHDRLEEQKAKTGKVRALILKGRQQGACLDPKTRILTADLRWIPLSDVKVGDELVATDENTGKGTTRKMRTATVQKVWHTSPEAYRVTLEDGRSVICSGKHRWLSRKSQVVPAWRSIDGTGQSRSGLAVGDLLRVVCTPWGDASMDDAWFGGVIDGEGSLDFVNRSGVDMAVSQCAGRVLDRMLKHCDRRGYKYCVVSDDGPRKTKYGQRAVHAISCSNMPDVLTMVGMSRPERFIDSRFWEGKRLPDGGWMKITAIEPIGEMPLMDIQTTTGTFIAEGVVSHNSTYCSARFYHQCTLSGKSALIVAHEDKATSNLFDMVKRYQEHNPLAPSTKSSNAKELVFSALDSGYKLATAGTDDVGRGNTSQLIHASEAAFWRNPEKHMAGLGNTVADMEGTEIIMESTANGVGNLFHQLWQSAEAGQGDYIAIFVPWFWTLEYWANPGTDFQKTDEEIDLAAAYGLNDGQLQWRRNKILSYGEGMSWLFQQEYPMCAQEAFITSTTNPLISPAHVNEAASSSFRDMYGPLLIGVDPAGDGVNDADRTAIAFRQGRVVKRIEYHQGLNTMQIAGKVAQYAKDLEPEMIFVDKGGLGAGVFDRLTELGVTVTGVNSATSATESDKYDNKRAEMWWRMRDWFADKPNRIPDNGALISDLTSPQPKVSSNGRRLLEKKEDMKKRGVRSPDGGDAVALTFAEPVLSRVAQESFLSADRKAPTKAGY